MIPLPQCPCQPSIVTHLAQQRVEGHKLGGLQPARGAGHQGGVQHAAEPARLLDRLEQPGPVHQGVQLRVQTRRCVPQRRLRIVAPPVGGQLCPGVRHRLGAVQRRAEQHLAGAPLACTGRKVGECQRLALRLRLLETRVRDCKAAHVTQGTSTHPHVVERPEGILVWVADVEAVLARGADEAPPLGLPTLPHPRRVRCAHVTQVVPCPRVPHARLMVRHKLQGRVRTGESVSFSASRP